jgi:hypothetical protein
MPPDASCGALPQTACCWAPPNTPTSRDHRPGTGGRTRGSTAPAGRGGARRSGGNSRACPAVTALARGRSRQCRVPGPGCRPGAFPGRGADHGPRGGRGIPAARPGGNRAGPGHDALLRHRDHPQLHRPARLRPKPSGPPQRLRQTAPDRKDGRGEMAQSHRGAAATCLPAGAHHRPGYVQATGSTGRTPPGRQGGRPKVPGAGDLGRWRALPRWGGLAVTREPQADAE